MKCVTPLSGAPASTYPGQFSTAWISIFLTLAKRIGAMNTLGRETEHSAQFYAERHMPLAESACLRPGFH